jgi:Aspartyl/Asparaginyl beta-hydroxylase
MIVARKLPLRFDAARLQADLTRFEPGDWTPHFNTREYDGDWSGVALRASAKVGGAGGLQAGLNVGVDFVDTSMLDRSCYFREVLATFQCPVKSARLLKLGPGASIREHRDYDLGLDEDEARVHVPVATNPSVEFLLDGRRVVMNEGETWYLDLNRRHSVRNRGPTDRVHLVVDCVANEWFHAQLSLGVDPEEPTASADSSFRGFDQFRDLVLCDRALQKTLSETTDPTDFISLVERLGREREFDFNASDVEDALRAARRSWLVRWIQ